MPDDITDRELKDEAILRARRAGYPVSKTGGPVPPKIQIVVGWGVKRLNVWHRDSLGRLIED